MDLGNDPQGVPDVERAAENALAAGFVYVARVRDGEPEADVAAGERAVLTTADGRLELTTTDDYDGSVGTEGTYLSDSDYAALVNRSDPAMRRYRPVKDTLAKVRSWPGFLSWAPALLGLLVAGVVLWYAVQGDAGTKPSDVARAADEAAAWVVEPIEALGPAADAAEISAARERVARRRRRADRCLRRLSGERKIDVRVPGVECAPKEPPVFRDKAQEPLVLAVLGLLTALVGGAGAKRKLGFGQQPV